MKYELLTWTRNRMALMSESHLHLLAVGSGESAKAPTGHPMYAIRSTEERWLAAILWVTLPAADPAHLDFTVISHHRRHPLSAILVLSFALDHVRKAWTLDIADPRERAWFVARLDPGVRLRSTDDRIVAPPDLPAEVLEKWRLERVRLASVAGVDLGDPDKPAG